VHSFAEEFGVMPPQPHATSKETGSFSDTAIVDLLRTLNVDAKDRELADMEIEIRCVAISKLRPYPCAPEHKGGRKNGESKKGSLD
jgi:hypothetical protein